MRTLRLQELPLLLLAGLVFLPFMLLCLYAHPSADDWYMAATGRDLGLWGASVKWYTTITGRIVQQGVTSLHPIRLGAWAYKLWCLGLLIGLGAGIYRMVRAWLPGLDRSRTLVISAAGGMLLLWSMRSPAQGLYWVNGGNTYVLPAILQAFMLSLLARMDAAGWRRHVAVALLAATAAWCSELAMALQLLGIILFIVTHWLLHRRLVPLLLTALAATLVATAVVFLSPGNNWRSGIYHNEVHGHLVPALVLSAKLGVRQVLTWLTTSPYFLLSIPLLALWPAGQTTRRQACLWLSLALVLMVGTAWGGFFVGAWSMGKPLPPRAVNLLGFYFLLEWGLLVHAVTALFSCEKWQRPRLSPALYLLVLLALGASLRSPNPVKTAWRDLLSGDARKFDAECQHRYDLIRQSTQDEVTVPPLKTKPVSLYFNDLNPDPADWRNAGMASFFQKKAIHLTQP